jgi:glycosyltransferase involved in cell wall biosynthesis
MLNPCALTVSTIDGPYASAACCKKQLSVATWGEHIGVVGMLGQGGRVAGAEEGANEGLNEGGARKFQEVDNRDVGRTAGEFPPLAICWAPEAYTMQDGIVGRRSAGAGFLTAVAKARPKELRCYAASLDEAKRFKRFFVDAGAVGTKIGWIPLLRSERLRETGLLYWPDPLIASPAWRRAATGDDRSYSICGVTHSLTPHPVMEAIASLLIAPLHSWDALVCTSRAARDSIRTVLETAGEYLGERFGAARFSLPQMPLIPLGVDCETYSFSERNRIEARQALGITPSEVVVSYIGRLTAKTKAHPLPMHLALEQAAHGHQVVLLQSGSPPTTRTDKVLQEEARRYCPSVRHIFVDGRAAGAMEQVLAATDVFTSLVDNFQETFGLTPIEAMATGVPSVVSDWNGYRDTIRDTTDGFRVPTLSMPPGSGSVIANRFDWGIDNYASYMFHAAQQIAIDIDNAIQAYRTLISNSDLRKKMGQAARERARANYDWKVILTKYTALWEELAERRRADVDFHSRQYSPRRRPDRADPFTMFATYATEVLALEMEFQRRTERSLEEATALLKLNHSATDPKDRAVLPSYPLVEKILMELTNDTWVDLAHLRTGCSGYGRDAIDRAVVWLCKFGVLRSRGKTSDNAVGILSDANKIERELMFNRIPGYEHQ